jgi:O-antigen ligase
VWFYLLVATSVSIPFSIPLNRNLTFALATMTVVVCDWRMLKYNLIDNKRVLLAGLIGLLNLFGLAYSANIPLGFALLERSAITVAMPVMIVMVVPTREEIDKLLYFFTIGCLAACFYCLGFSLWRIYQEGGLINESKITDRTYYYFINNELTESALKISPIYLGMYVNLCIGYLMVKIFILKDRSRGAVVLLVTLHLFQAIILAISAILAMLVIWLIVMTWLALQLTFKRRLMLFGILATSLVAAVIGSYYIKPIRDRLFVDLNYDFTRGHVSNWSGITMRLAVWNCALDAARETPLLGHGTGDADEALLKVYREKRFELAVMLNLNTHNQYLHSYLMHGIIGIAVLLAILILPLLTFATERDYLLLIFIAILALGFVTEVILLVQKGIVFFSIFYPLLYLPTVSKK